MNRRIVITGIIVILLVILGDYFYQNNQSQEFNTESIKIGALYALSGPAAVYGEMSIQGVNDAVIDFEKKTNSQVDLIIEDTAGDPKIAVSAATKLFNIDKVKYAIVGTSAVTAAISPLADQYKSLVITDAAGYGLTTGKSYLFQNLMPSLNNIADKINGNKDWKKVAIVYINDDFGSRWAEKTRINLQGRIVELFAFEKTSTDFKTQAAKIKQLGPDVLVIIGYGPALNQVYADIETLGIQSPKLTYLSCTLPGVLTDNRFSLGGDYSYEYKQIGNKNTFYSLAYENTLTILNVAYKTNGDVDKSMNYLKNTGVDGLYGKVIFNDQGVVERDLVLTKIEDGKCLPIE